MLERRPEEVIRKAVKGMLPRNRLARQQLTKLKVYAGPGSPAPGAAAEADGEDKDGRRAENEEKTDEQPEAERTAEERPRSSSG